MIPLWIEELLSALGEPTLWLLLPIVAFQFLADRVRSDPSGEPARREVNRR